LYTPMAQEVRVWRTWMNVAVRTPLPPAALAESVKREVARVDKDIPVMRLQAMDELVARSFSGRHLSLALLGAFAVMALLLGLLVLAAGYLPARRASRVEPAAALRAE